MLVCTISIFLSEAAAQPGVGGELVGCHRAEAAVTALKSCCAPQVHFRPSRALIAVETACVTSRMAHEPVSCQAECVTCQRAEAWSGHVSSPRRRDLWGLVALYRCHSLCLLQPAPSGSP